MRYGQTPGAKLQHATRRTDGNANFSRSARIRARPRCVPDHRATRRASARPITCSIVFISPCASSMSLRPPRAGRTPRRATARKLPAWPTPSSISVGVSGTGSYSGRSISSETPCDTRFRGRNGIAARCDGG